LKIKNRQEQL